MENRHRNSLAPKRLVGSSPVFLEEVRKIPIIAQCNSSVLIYGETGTGKEIFAQQIHHSSQRASNPFVPVNCGAIPLELAENELFGHTPGAFTGAVSKPGLVHEAQGGTLFLDEIDNLPQLAQVKLLRFLQDKTYRPLGSTKELRAEVRVVAATNVDPAEAVGFGKLRLDLYYRLNVISLRLPPLRERREDIPVLADHFLKKMAATTAKAVTDFSPLARQKLLSHDWPGNVRELEHAIERAVVLCQTNVIQDKDILIREPEIHICEESFKAAKERFIKAFEKTYIEKLLLIHGGNISKAAQAAQKHRRAFWELVRKHRIDVAKFKTEGQWRSAH